MPCLPSLFQVLWKIQKLKASRAGKEWFGGGSLRTARTGSLGGPPLIGGRGEAGPPGPGELPPPRPTQLLPAHPPEAFHLRESQIRALAVDVLLLSGQNIAGTFRSGLNTVSTLAAFGIPGRTQVCFHMQQDNCTTSLPPGSSAPHPLSPPVPLVACSAPEQASEQPFQVALGSEHLSHVTLPIGLLGAERG